MPYYMGDYYGLAGRSRGDYYRGDPGFFSFIGKLAKTAVGFIPGVGPLVRAGADVAGGALAKRGTSSMVRAGGQIAESARGLGKMVLKHPVISAAGAAGVIGAAGSVAETIHARRAAARAAAGAGRAHRRMNVCNPRALRRAIRRTHGFAKLAMRTIHLVHPKRKARFGGFRRKRKRA